MLDCTREAWDRTSVVSTLGLVEDAPLMSLAFDKQAILSSKLTLHI